MIPVDAQKMGEESTPKGGQGIPDGGNCWDTPLRVVLRKRAILPRFRFQVPIFFPPFPVPVPTLKFKVIFTIQTPAGYHDFCYFSRQLHACVSQCPVRVSLIFFEQQEPEPEPRARIWFRFFLGQIIRFWRFRFRNTASEKEEGTIKETLDPSGFEEDKEDEAMYMNLDVCIDKADEEDYKIGWLEDSTNVMSSDGDVE
jgi:hypothetical protein